MMRTFKKLACLSLVMTVALGCGPDAAQQAPGTSEHPLLPRYPDEIEVTQMHGPLIIRNLTENYDLKGASHPLWSTWYYPLYSPYFFLTLGEGSKKQLSPLEKYDYYAKHLAKVKRNPNSNAQGWEAKRYADNRYENKANNGGEWMGFCHATAAAAIAQPEPSYSWNAGPFTFSTADLKALLVRTYEDVQGSRNFGMNYGADRSLKRPYVSQQDIYPDQLHKLIQVYLGERRKTFYIDRHAGAEVWNAPVISASIMLSKDRNNANILNGKMVLTLAESLLTSVDPKDRDPETYRFLEGKNLNAWPHTFAYKLYGAWQEDGSFKTEWGEWVGDNYEHHPDLVTVLPDQITARSSSNPHIDTEIVDEILERARKQR